MNKYLTIAMAGLFCTSFGFSKAKLEKKEKVEATVAVTEEACSAMLHNKKGANGFALSGLFGFLKVDSLLENRYNRYENKMTYKRIGLGISYYKTYQNNVFWGATFDFITNLGSKKTDGTYRLMLFPNAEHPEPHPFPVPMKYQQKRPFTVSLTGKMGYVYGSFMPFVSLSLRESYVVHKVHVLSNNYHKEEKDVNFGISPGIGAMVKHGNFMYGLEYGYHKESTFGLEGYADNTHELKNKGAHSVSFRISYFL